MRTRIFEAAAAALILVVSSGCAKPKDVKVSVEAPLSVKRGESFLVKASVTNSATKAQKLVSLDVGDAWLAGVAIESTDPPFAEASHIPIDNTMSYTYGLMVNPGETRTVLIRARAVKEGDHGSGIDFCINSETSFVSYPIRTVVEAR